MIHETNLVGLRRTLHKNPDLSNREAGTVRILEEFLHPFSPDAWLKGLGGEGFALIYEGAEPGPRILLRADLDALPLPETLSIDHGSCRDGTSHKCGHDGHMTILAGVASALHRRRPARGAAILLFQPAEETGEGAARVIQHPAFETLAPDLVFALHNLPGFPLGSVVVGEGPFASASKGLVVELQGATSHAAEPHQGRSPALAVAALIQGLCGAPQSFTALHEAGQVTVIHARVGTIAFGTSPGEAVVMATLRSHEQEVMDRLAERCLALAQGIGQAHDLQVTTRWTEAFPATINDPRAVGCVLQASKRTGRQVVTPPVPFPWSEDFGHFTARYAGSLFGLGAGEQHPPLHHPTYDFPDALLPLGTEMMLQLVRDSIGEVS